MIRTTTRTTSGDNAAPLDATRSCSLLDVRWVVFVAFYTAQLTTTLTVEQIRGAIEGPGDLPGKQVATIAHNTAVDYLRDQHAQVQEFPTPGQMFKALFDKNVDAVVFNGPMLLYYAAHEGKGRVKIVGPQFNSAPIGIVFQLDSPLRRKVDGALLALREKAPISNSTTSGSEALREGLR